MDHKTVPQQYDAKLRNSSFAQNILYHTKVCSIKIIVNSHLKLYIGIDIMRYYFPHGIRQNYGNKAIAIMINTIYKEMQKVIFLFSPISIFLKSIIIFNYSCIFSSSFSILAKNRLIL